MFREAPEQVAASDRARPAKVGVLTFHRCINYGSYWQARCLVEGLRARGHDAVLLDHWSRPIERTEWRSAMQPLLPRRSSRDDVGRYAVKARKFQDCFARLPLSPRFPLDEPAAMPPVDLLVMGSDEVWNFSHPWYGGRALFFGVGTPARRKVSYAASFGNYDAEAGMGPDWAEQLRGFDAISVRDYNAFRLVSEATGREPALVLDPCLQFPPSVEPTGEERPYAAVYGHSFSREFGILARDWAQRRGLRLISIGYRNDWADEQRIEADPIDFARLIAGAEAVLTNFFHGCVFALVNGKSFVCAGTPYRMNKVRDLTRLMGVERCLLRDGEDDLAPLLDTWRPDRARATWSQLQKQSEAYLQLVLA